MNARKHHVLLEERRGLAAQENIYDIKNALVVGNPMQEIDCSPDSSFENFQHLFGDYCLVYCELANSTPHSGHIVDDGFVPLVTKNARTSCVFSGNDIIRMKKQVVGVRIVKTHNGFDEHHYIGNVACASILNNVCLGKNFKTLCIWCWIERGIIEQRTDKRNNLIYLSFGIKVARETCCVCGKSSNYSTPCEHIFDHYPSALSICQFEHFNDIALER